MYFLLNRGFSGACVFGSHAQSECDVFKHRHMPEQSVMLEHKTHLPVTHMQMRGVFPTECNRSLVCGFQPRDDAQQSGFAAARWSKQRHQFARGNVQIDLAQGVEVTKLLADVSNFNAHT